MELSMSLVLCIAAGASCPFLACAAFLTARAERIARQQDALTERGLYERGEEAARSQRDRCAPSPRTPLEKKLRSAGVHIGEKACIVAVFAAMAVAFAVGFHATGSLLGGGLPAVLVAIVAHAMLDRGIRRRRELFDAQLARALPRISAGVRGSFTLERAFRSVAVHLDEPLKGEFSRVLADVAYGMPFSLALEGMAERTQHADVRMLAAATRIGQRRGGSAAASLGMISDRVSARLKTSCELKAEVASAKMAQWFVAGAMPLLFLIMYATNADFASFYREEPLGWGVLAAASICEAVGLFLAHRIVSFSA